LGGCSLNQPSRLAPLTLCPESRNANANLNFFRAVPRSQSLHSSAGSTVPSPVVACRLPQHRHYAPRKKEKNIREKLLFFPFFCGAWGCFLLEYLLTPCGCLLLFFEESQGLFL